MGTTTNLLAGIGTIYTAPVGEALPADDDVDSGIITPGGNWTATGFTQDGCTVDYTPTYEDVIVDQHKAPVDSILTAESGSIAFTLAESDAAALAAAFGVAYTTVAAAANQTGQSNLGVGDSTKVKKAILIIGTAPGGYSRWVYCPKAVPEAKVSIKLEKKHNGIAQQYKLLTDTSQSAGQRLFQVKDITAVPTS